MKAVRATFRLIVLAGLVLVSLPSAFASRTPVRRARWLQRVSRRGLRLLGARVRVRGDAPSAGLIVSNHLSYLDILVIGSMVPAVFVAKDDVLYWPVVGWLGGLVNTIFVDRKRRMSVRRSLAEVRAMLGADVAVTLFPEGTSSDGSSVLPFKTSLFEVASNHASTPAVVRYELPGGRAADELCYWRDMTFAPHCWHVLGLRGFTVDLCFGPSRPPTAGRKILAASLRDEILDLRGEGEGRGLLRAFQAECRLAPPLRANGKLAS